MKLTSKNQQHFKPNDLSSSGDERSLYFLRLFHGHQKPHVQLSVPLLMNVILAEERRADSHLPHIILKSVSPGDKKYFFP